MEEEVPKEIQKKLLFIANLERKIKSYRNITSSGGSIILVSNDISYIVQYYRSKRVVENIFIIFINILSNPVRTMKFVIRSGFGPGSIKYMDRTLGYDLTDYLVKFEFYVRTDKIIAWKKIFTLNSLSEDEKKEFIRINLFKIIWDIGKALYGLHVMNIIHNDARIDNVGIQNGKFVLFDFDGSGEPEIKNKYFKDDFKDFKNSIIFNIDNDIDLSWFGNNTTNINLTLFKYLSNKRIQDENIDREDVERKTEIYNETLEYLENLSIINL